jgi:hypothetical protein
MYQLTTKTISMSFYKLSNRFEVILRCAQNVTLLSKQHHVTLQQPRVTLQKPRVTLPEALRHAAEASRNAAEASRNAANATLH